MGKEQDGVETRADLICPYCESPIEKVQTVRRELTERTAFGTRFQVIALACPTCRKLLGFYHAS